MLTLKIGEEEIPLELGIKTGRPLPTPNMQKVVGADFIFNKQINMTIKALKATLFTLVLVNNESYKIEWVVLLILWKLP